MKVTSYTVKNTKKSTVELPLELTAENVEALVAQAIRVYTDRNHPGLSKVKTRGEVVASTKKIYRQKGTGGARHGAKSAPIFVGGGKAHGPKGIKRVLTLSKKMKLKALAGALTLKAKEGKLFVIDNLSELTKTKQAAIFIKGIIDGEQFKKDLRLIVALSPENQSVQKTLRNLKNLNVVNYQNLSLLDVVRSGALLIDKSALNYKKSTVKVDGFGDAKKSEKKEIKKAVTKSDTKKTPKKSKDSKK